MKRNPKLLYRTVTNRAKVKPGVAALTTADGVTATANEAAEELAKFYSTVFQPKADVHLENAVILSPKQALADITVTTDSMLKILLTLNTRKSPGADEITQFILK